MIAWREVVSEVITLAQDGEDGHEQLGLLKWSESGARALLGKLVSRELAAGTLSLVTHVTSNQRRRSDGSGGAAGARRMVELLITGLRLQSAAP